MRKHSTAKKAKQERSSFKKNAQTLSKPISSMHKGTQKANKNITFIPEMGIPDSSFFTKLKKEGHKQFPYEKRCRFSYEENQSASLSLPYSNDQLIAKQSVHQELLEMSKASIVEHANRRVDLFFYTLIAYYKTSCFPRYTQTTLQYGIGRTTKEEGCITEACHSSFTPSLLDNIIFRNKESEEKLKSLLSGTHLLNNLNSTVELPPFVNDLDDLLESICRPKCLKIIHHTVTGQINPIEGLTDFLNMMRDALRDLKEKAECTKPSFFSEKQKSISPELIDLVTMGTFADTYSEETETVADEYIQMLLRMRSEERKKCGTKSKREKIYLKKISEMQDEILSSNSEANVGYTL